MRPIPIFLVLSSLFGTAPTRNLQAQVVFGPGDPGRVEAEQTFVAGVIKAEVYRDIGGNAVSALTGSPKYPNQPDETRFLKFMEFPPGGDDGSRPPSDVSNNYGVRISGFVIPKQTANYVFFIASDDNGELWLSTSDDPANKRLIAREPEWNPVRAWTAPTRRPGCPDNGGTQCDNRSQPIRLEADKRYYIEAFVKEGVGGDNLAVTWIKQGEPDPADGALPIGSEFLGALSDARQNQPPAITLQPQNQTVDSGARVSFTTTAIGTPTPRYQWRLNGVNLPGETSPTLVLANVQPSNSGLYSVAVQNSLGAAASQAAILSVRAPALALADAFERRSNYFALFFTGRGSNEKYTRQTREPFHANKNGSTSAWIAWTPLTTGVATFTTAGSTFDTLLAVYTGSVLTNLIRLVSDDDSGGALTSRVSFNASAGVQYQIAIDGFNGASGDVVLTWGLDPFGDTLPVVSEIEKEPSSPSVVPGTRVRLSVQALELPTGARTIGAQVQWFHNGKEIQDATNNVLVIPSVQRQEVGGYVARLFTITEMRDRFENIILSTSRVYSAPAILQINTAGETNVSALDKLGDLVVGTNRVSQFTALATARRIGPSFNTLGVAAAAPARGFSGSQVFNTSCVNPEPPPCSPATKEPSEPIHGGEIGGASMWMSYQPLVDGLLTIDSSDSDFPNVVAVYTGPGALMSGLTEVSYRLGPIPKGNGKLVELQAVKDRIYYIAVDGVRGPTGDVAKGLVTLKYALTSDCPLVRFVTTDTTTQGSWKTKYGADGRVVVGDPTTLLPGYILVAPSGPSSYTWLASTLAMRALQKDGSVTDRLAACWYANNSFDLGLNVTGSELRRVALYFLDWEGGREQQVEIFAAGGAGPPLNTQTVTGFYDGKYLVWDIKGNVTIRVKSTVAANVVLSGLFFDTPGAGTPVVTFVTTDTTTQGSWKTKYGADGRVVVSDPATLLPGYIPVAPSGPSSYTWLASTAEMRALQKTGLATDRLAACWYAANSFDLGLNVTGSELRRVALYFLDWEGGREQRVEIFAAGGTGPPLNTQTVTGFYGGKYLVWDIKGNVTIRVKSTVAANVVLSGLFFDTPGCLSTGGLLGFMHSREAINSRLFINQFERATLAGGFRLNAVVEPHRRYLIEASTDLIHWTFLGADMAPPSGFVEFLDADAAKLPHRFYRIIEKPANPGE
ncbi:MAG: immunoglobulin domain-containing protein [Verrucomicrobia bacterium]|nr:immunoglobulin domain-containing protein [Verrucomicrobiota bacterium]